MQIKTLGFKKEPLSNNNTDTLKELLHSLQGKQIDFDEKLMKAAELIETLPENDIKEEIFKGMEPPCVSYIRAALDRLLYIRKHPWGLFFT